MAQRNEIRSLTGLRGVAALFVVCYNYFQHRLSPGLPATIVAHGYVAVDLFFVLSGFVMSVTYRNTFAGAFTPAAYAGFLRKRLARIYPLFLAMTLLAVLLAVCGASHQIVPTLRTAWCNILLVQGWGLADSIIGPSWSISTEFGAYLLFPVLVRAIGGGSGGGSHLRVLAAGALAAAALFFAASRPDMVVGEVGRVTRNGPLDIYAAGTAYPLLRCLGGFSLGLVAFHVGRMPLVRRWAAWKPAGDVAALLVLALLAVRGSDVLATLLFVPLVVCLANERSVASGLLGRPAIHWLGMTSYSIYMVHTLVAASLQESVQALLVRLRVPHAYTASFIALVAPVLIIAALTFHAIEKPAQNWSHGLVAARRRPADTPLATR